MPKGDFLSPKEISNRIKAKGLQKLRFYCEMCQKQCRDANGFANHCASEVHTRQMELFAQNPDKFLDHFSTEFEESFMALLSRRFGVRRVAANQVYNEYIQDKQHTHMNSTIWPTLTDFVKYLGRTGKCVIDETERGWFIAWINRDPALIKRQEAWQKRAAADLDEETRIDLELNAQAEAAVRRASADGGSAAAPAFTPLERSGDAGSDPDGGGVMDSSSSSGGGVSSTSGGGAVRIRLGIGAATGGPARDHRDSGDDDGAVDGGRTSGLRASTSAAGPSLSSSSAAGLLRVGQKRPRFDVEEDEEEEQDIRHTQISSSSASPSSSALATAGHARAHLGNTPASLLPALASSAVAAGALPLPPPPHSNVERLIAEDLRRMIASSSSSSSVSSVSSRAPPRASRFDSVGASSSSSSSFASGPAPSSASGTATSAAFPTQRLPAPPSVSSSAAPSSSWLYPGLVVKVMNKRVGDGAYYKAKGTIVDILEGGFLGVIRISGSSDVLKVDVDDLETVLPLVGGTVRILRGPHRGSNGVLLEIHEDRFCADVQLLVPPPAGQQRGEARAGAKVCGLEYEDVCKVDTDASAAAALL